MRKFAIASLLVSLTAILAAQNPAPIAAPLYIQSTPPGSTASPYFWFDTSTNTLKLLKTTDTWVSLGESVSSATSSWGSISGNIGTQLDLMSLLNEKAFADDLNTLDIELDGKANLTHNHSISNIIASGTPSSSTYLRGDGSWAGISSTGSVTKLRVSADVSNTTTTFSDITGLTIPVTSGTTYYFDCKLTYTTAATTTGVVPGSYDCYITSYFELGGTVFESDPSNTIRIAAGVKPAAPRSIRIIVEDIKALLEELVLAAEKK